MFFILIIISLQANQIFTHKINDHYSNNPNIAHVVENRTLRMKILYPNEKNIVYPLNIRITPKNNPFENNEECEKEPFEDSLKDVNLLSYNVFFGCVYLVEINSDKIEYTINNTLIEDVEINLIQEDVNRFNITWEKTNVVNSNVSIKFKKFSEGQFILNDVLTEYDYNLTKMHLISRKSYGIRIQLGDFYKIIIIENNSPYREEIIYYKIPNSLKNVLSCETVDAFDLLNITYLNNNKWKIDWKPYEKFQPKKLVYSINGIDLKNIENNLNRSFSIVEIDELKSNEEYIIINSTFYYGLINFENCKWESSINFKVPFIPETNYIFEICIGVVAIFSIIIALICHYYKRIIETVKLFLPNSPDNSIQRINETSITGIIKINPNYNPLEFTDNQYDQYEIPRNKIELKHEIGRGTFGKVFYAKWYNSNTTRDYLMVAVKQLKDEATLDELCDFKTEIDILKSVGEHPNIVRLLGCCALQIPYLMVMEFVACGALKNYLMQLRIKWERKKNQQHFFPSDMDVHFWAQTSSNPRMVTSAASDSSSSSYISPNKSPLFVPSTTAGYWANKEPNSPRHFFINSQKFNYSPTQAASSSSAEYSPFLADFIETLPKIASNQQPSTSEEEKTPAIEDFTSVLTPELNHIELHDFATQIANGMAHLESMSIIHRDLAARNILITPDKKLKISDFGMSKRGSYIIRSNKPLPLRWMAIEAIQNKQCDSKSDVWSFGVVLWEIGTLGAHPYEDIPNELILDSLINGVRLNRPEICTNELYTLMQHCWNEVSENRPSFKELHGNLTSVKNKVYVDFKTINPNYNFPPIEEKPQCTKNMTNT